MNLREIALQEIDLENETFRISDTLDREPVCESLRTIGQLNPVALAEGDSRYLIVCGFRRLHALKALGQEKALAWILSGGSPVQYFDLALRENVAHRQLSPLEKARSVYKLVNAFGVSPQTVTEVYLPVLGLAPHPGVLKSCLALSGAHPELQKCLMETRLTQSSVEALAEKPLQFQERFARLMDRIRLTASLQKKTLGLFEELAAISGGEFGEPLLAPEARQIVDDPNRSSFQRGEELTAFLYQMRFPGLSRAVHKFSADKKLLGLPGTIRISSDPYFESGDLRVEFDASSPAQFRQKVEALYSASRNPALEELFRVG